MELYLNKEKKGVWEINPRLTVGQLKKSLLEWNNINKLGNVNIRIIFNNEEELAPVVFASDKYDKLNFTDKKDLLKGGKILITQLNKDKTIKTQNTQNTQNTKLTLKSLSKFTGMKDVDYLILQNLEDADLVNICSVNKYLRSLCNEQFWKKRFEEKHPNFVNLLKLVKLPDKTYKQLYLEEISGYNLYMDIQKESEYIAKNKIDPSDILILTNLNLEDKNSDELHTLVKTIRYPGKKFNVDVPVSPFFLSAKDLFDYRKNNKIYYNAFDDEKRFRFDDDKKVWKDNPYGLPVLPF